MSTHQDLTPEPHISISENFRRLSKKGLLYYTEDLRRSSCKNLIWASQKNFHASTHAEHIQELNARTRISTRSSHKDLYEIMHRHLKDFTRTFSRSSHKDLYKIMHCKDLLEGFARISTRSTHKKLRKTLTKIFMPGPPRESRKIVIKGPAAAGASHKSFHTSNCETWHLQGLHARTS